MPTFAAPALNAAESEGTRNWMLMQQMTALKAQQAGQGDFLNYITQNNQPTPPTAMNPPAGQASRPSVPSATTGGAPQGPYSGDAAASKDFQQPQSILPPSLQQMVLAIRKNNPGASPQEVMAALETAEPFMDAQQKQAMDLMKQQLQVYKTQADEDYKRGSLADRQKRTAAYVKHLKQLEARGDPRAMTAEGMKILAGTRQLQTRLAQINRVLQAGTKPDGTPLTADDRKKLGEAVDTLTQAISQSQDYYRTFMQVRAGAYGQQFESSNPPPEEPDVSTTGGDSGGGQ